MVAMLKFFKKEQLNLSLGTVHIFLSFLIVSSLVNFIITQKHFDNPLITQLNFVNLTLSSIAIALLIQQRLFDRLDKLPGLFMALFSVKLFIIPFAIVLLSNYALVMLGNFCFSIIFLTLLLNKRLLFLTSLISLVLSLLYYQIVLFFYQDHIIEYNSIFQEDFTNLLASMVQILAIIILLYYKQNELEIKLDSMKNFAKVVAQEVFPTLSIIESNLAVLKTTLKDKDDIFDSVISQCYGARSRLNGITDNIRIIGNINNLYYKTHSLAKILSEVVKDFVVSSVIQPTINLVIHNDLEFYGSAKMIRCLVYNLIDNAFQHGGKNVKLDIIMTGDNVIFQDNGLGIEAADLEHIFDPFLSSNANHLGLGLTVCKEIITNHGGEITVISLPNNHTTFIVTLPKK
jgi:signal transduction histidine kinase